MSELTKEYFDKRLANFATKDDLLELATQSEVKAMRVDINGIKEVLGEIRKDINAYGKDILRHDRQISRLINDVKQLKLAAHAR